MHVVDPNHALYSTVLVVLFSLHVVDLNLAGMRSSGTECILCDACTMYKLYMHRCFYTWCIMNHAACSYTCTCISIFQKQEMHADNN